MQLNLSRGKTEGTDYVFVRYRISFVLFKLKLGRFNKQKKHWWKTK